MFNCSNKFELALGFTEKLTKTTNYYQKNYQVDFNKKYEEEKKIENFINKFF